MRHAATIVARNVERFIGRMPRSLRALGRLLRRSRRAALPAPAVHPWMI